MIISTAAILVIGDEILSGKTDESNARLLISELRELGVSLRCISIVPDEVEAVASAVRDMALCANYVFTSGGVGPTHDDVTMLGIARAFGRSIVRHPELEARIRARFGDDVSESRLRMADVPAGSELVSVPDMRWPVVVCQNVYILPGVPELFRQKFAAIRERFRVDPFCAHTIYTLEDEFDIAEGLRKVARTFPQVAIGSYPNFASPNYRVKLTLESKDAAMLKSALAALLAQLDHERIVSCE